MTKLLIIGVGAAACSDIEEGLRVAIVPAREFLKFTS
jgi:hypothetical protein